MSNELKTIKISLSDRERNFCEDDQHRSETNLKDLILFTKENELDEQKPMDEEKFAKLSAINISCLELGGLTLSSSAIKLLGDCGAQKLQCLRIYDCLNVNDEAIKLFGKFLFSILFKQSHMIHTFLFINIPRSTIWKNYCSS